MIYKNSIESAREVFGDEKAEMVASLNFLIYVLRIMQAYPKDLDLKWDRHGIPYVNRTIQRRKHD